MHVGDCKCLCLLVLGWAGDSSRLTPPLSPEDPPMTLEGRIASRRIDVTFL